MTLRDTSVVGEIASWLRHIDRLDEIPGAKRGLPGLNPLWDASFAIEREFSGSDTYDSTEDTLEHIGTVQRFLGEVVTDLFFRAGRHDASKLVEPEKAVFDEYTPKLRDSTYGSDEYKAFLEGMGEGLKHHYAVNDHHPEHFEHGIHDMDLLQLMEMLADWKAATERHADGDLGESIKLNAERFGYGPEIRRLLRLTAERLGWI